MSLIPTSRHMGLLVETRSMGWIFGICYCLTSVCMTFGLFNVIVAIYAQGPGEREFDICSPNLHRQFTHFLLFPLYDYVEDRSVF